MANDPRLSSQAILDVSDFRVLHHVSVDELVAAHYARWGAEPFAIVLPVLAHEGPTFENDLGADVVRVRYARGPDEMTLPDVARVALDRGLEVYLSVEASLSFVPGEALRIVDISRDTAARACFGKQETRQLLAEFVRNAVARIDEVCGGLPMREGGATHVSGVVIDAVDFWPMSASGVRLELTCFCSTCSAVLDEGGVRVRDFQKFPNAWNLALRDTGTGIDYVDDLDRDTTPEELLARSALKGFDSELREHLRGEERQMRAAAELLLSYVRARDDQTRSALIDFFNLVDLDLRRVVIGEGSPYNWTSGSFISTLDATEVCDELWFDPSGYALTTSRVAFRSYMWERSRYMLDAFARLVSAAEDSDLLISTGLGRLGIKGVKSLVELRRRQMLSAAMGGRLALRTLPIHPNRLGFVAAAMDDEISALLAEVSVPETLADLRETPRII